MPSSPGQAPTATPSRASPAETPSRWRAAPRAAASRARASDAVAPHTPPLGEPREERPSAGMVANPWTPWAPSHWRGWRGFPGRCGGTRIPRQLFQTSRPLARNPSLPIRASQRALASQNVPLTMCRPAPNQSRPHMWLALYNAQAPLPICTALVRHGIVRTAMVPHRARAGDGTEQQ